MQGRFRFYEDRKSKIIGEIMSGDRGELPEWSDEEEDSSTDSEASNDSAASKAKSENPDSKSNQAGNTLKYRNNFKFELAAFKAGSLFSDCKTCRMKTIECICQFCLFCGEEGCECDKLQLLERLMGGERPNGEKVSEF